MEISSQGFFHWQFVPVSESLERGGGEGRGGGGERGDLDKVSLPLFANIGKY